MSDIDTVLELAKRPSHYGYSRDEANMIVANFADVIVRLNALAEALRTVRAEVELPEHVAALIGAALEAVEL